MTIQKQTLTLWQVPRKGALALARLARVPWAGLVAALGRLAEERARL